MYRVIWLLALLGSATSQRLSFRSVYGGLCSPRKIRAYGGALFVAEAGSGAAVTPTDPANETNCALVRGNYQCIGNTSQVTRVLMDGSSSQVVLDGLFSAREVPNGRDTTGSADVVFDADGTMLTVVGLGMNGTLLKERGIDMSIGYFGAVLRGNNSGYTVSALPYQAEETNDYDGAGPDSNPYHCALSGTKFYLADAGCNCIMTYDSLGDTTMVDPASVAVIPPYTGLTAVPTDQPLCTGVTPPMGPPWCGQYQDANGTWRYDTQAVPTSVYKRPGFASKIYVTTLSGVIWNDPVAQVIEMDLDANEYPIESTIRQVAGPFYAVVDMAFDGQDQLYVLEVNPGSPTVPFSGRLTRVDLASGRSEVVALEDLVSPSGISITDGQIFVTNNTLSVGIDDCNGEIIVADLTTPAPSPVVTPTAPTVPTAPAAPTAPTSPTSPVAPTAPTAPVTSPAPSAAPATPTAPSTATTTTTTTSTSASWIAQSFLSALLATMFSVCCLFV